MRVDAARGTVLSRIVMRFVLAPRILWSAMLAIGCSSPPEPPAKSAAEVKPEVVPSERAPQPERPESSPGVKDDGTIVSAVTWFDGTLEAALTAAKAEGKLVFVDVGAYWCPPCHRLDEETASPTPRRRSSGTTASPSSAAAAVRPRRT